MLSFLHFISLLALVRLHLAATSPGKNLNDGLHPHEGSRATKFSPRNAAGTPWANKTVLYQFEDSFSSEERQSIVAEMNSIERGSCVRFLPFDEQRDANWIFFTKNFSGCFSPVGMQGGKQLLSLQGDCGSRGKVAHELMHALGFFHQHQSRNRDNYVRILWENIPEEHRESFQKIEENNDIGTAFAYDYNSITHYDRKAFSSNGEDTMEPLQEAVIIGESEHLTDTDFRKVNTIYDCGDRKSQAEQPTSVFASISDKFMSFLGK